MKKFLLTLIFILFPLYAISMEIPQNINEYLNKPYLGLTYLQALQKKEPFLLIFANPNDLTTIIKLSSIGEMIYNEFKEQYNFCVINVKAKENKALTKAYNVTKLPALYLIDTQNKTYIFVPEKYYKKNKLKYILTKFKNGTLF